MRLLSYAIFILVSGCLDLEIVSPRNGDEFVAGERIEFGAQAEDALKGKIRWIVNGTHMGTGESFATATLSVGWHEVVAELGEDDNALKDVVHVQVISWNAIPAPNMAPVRAMVRDGVQKETWLAVPGEGVYKVDDLGGAHLFSASTGDLPSDEVRDLTLRGGEVWVGTSAGVARYDGSVWETYTHLDGLPSVDVRALSVDARDSHLWLATDTHIVSLAASRLSREAIDLPDLVAHAPTDINIKSRSKGPELVLETTIANQGDGVLEIETLPDPNTDHKVATQKIYHGEWIVAQYPVGEFFFVEHEDHHHYHLNAFTIYQLREVLPGNGVGAILSQSLKVSWCLNDFLSVSLGAGEEQYTCSTNLQGISVGWADRYLSRLSGQSIAIAGIPPGEYWVVVMATSVFAEKDYQNNTAMTKVRFDAQGNVTGLEEIGPKGPPTGEGVKQRG